jgi:hypothetical protein
MLVTSYGLNAVTGDRCGVLSLECPFFDKARSHKTLMDGAIVPPGG